MQQRADKKPVQASQNAQTEPDAKGAAGAKSKVRDLAGAGFDVQAKSLEPGKQEAPAAGGSPLGETTEELRANPAIKISELGTFVGEKGMPKAVGSQIMAGIAQEGVSDATSLKQALDEYVDEGRVWLSSVATSAATYNWIRFYAGDTEVGYIFKGGALAAIVSDGAINMT